MAAVSEVDRADRILALLSRDAKVQKVVADARLYDSLRENPAWKRLFDMVATKRSRWMEEVASRFMRPQRFWPKPEEIAYYQGFYQGAFFVLAHPEHAERNLEKVARVAWAMTLEGEEEE